MSWCMNMVPCYISKYHGIATEYYCICPPSELSEQYEFMIPDHSQHGSLFQTCDHISRHTVYLRTEVAKQALFPCTIY